MPRDPQPRLEAEIFESGIYQDACDDASAFVDKIPGGRINFHSITSFHHYGKTIYIVTVWYWKW